MCIADKTVDRMLSLDLSAVSTVLCDADGTLFPSEEPAYVASASVTQAFADQYGITGKFSPDHLRRTGTGRNFRSLTADLLREAGINAPTHELAAWIERERLAVTSRLAYTLRSDPEVIAVANQLLRRYRLAVVSSSATARLLACLQATGLDETFAASDVFSAEDSMPTPMSKPDPAIYRHALMTLNVTAAESLALEDSSTGVTSAVAAGIQTIGVVAFVAAEDRAERIGELFDAGASHVVSSWADLRGVLLPDAAISEVSEATAWRRFDDLDESSTAMA
jgi:beta-phosphoglucomutase-like phosphatase (HAD superfamily)